MYNPNDDTIICSDTDGPTTVENMSNTAVISDLTSFLSGPAARSMIETLIKAAIDKAMQPVCNKLEQISVEIVELKKENKRLEETVTKLSHEVADSARMIDELDQSSRMTSITMSSAAWVEQVNEDPFNIIGSFIQDTLKLSIDPNDILECFRIGKRQSPSLHQQTSQLNGSSRPILVKFSSTYTKGRVTKATRDLKSGKLKPPVYVNDDLSIQRRALFKAARP